MEGGRECLVVLVPLLCRDSLVRRVLALPAVKKSVTPLSDLVHEEEEEEGENLLGLLAV